MQRLQDRVVMVTGASAGIGEACARAFACEGARLVVAARREGRLRSLAVELEALGSPAIRVIPLDVRDADAVCAALEDLSGDWREVEVLVNNAGLSRGLDKLHEGKRLDWEEMIETNVKGLLHVDRQVVPWMVARGRGTVVHIGSVAGRQAYHGGNVYCATKFAVRGLTEGLRIDLLGTGVRVCSIDPGLVDTEFAHVRFRDDHDRARATYRGMVPLRAEDVAEAVVFAATRPDHVQIAELLLLPTDQATPSLVHRR